MPETLLITVRLLLENFLLKYSIPVHKMRYHKADPRKAPKTKIDMDKTLKWSSPSDPIPRVPNTAIKDNMVIGFTIVSAKVEK